MMTRHYSILVYIRLTACIAVAGTFFSVNAPLSSIADYSASPNLFTMSRKPIVPVRKQVFEKPQAEPEHWITVFVHGIKSIKPHVSLDNFFRFMSDDIHIDGQNEEVEFEREDLSAKPIIVFLISLIGIPITGGFFAKFYVFSAALSANLVWLTLIGVINSAIGAYYYLKIIVVMYMRDAREEMSVPPVSWGVATALVISLAATIYLGVLPQSVLGFAQRSAKVLVQQPDAPLTAGPAPIPAVHSTN